jgi:polar amino acid transport system substrate-binding protein
VLLVEDNPVIQAVARRMLNEPGIQTIIVNGGKELMKRLADQPKEPVNRFDLILMDIEMPEMDGLETTKKLRRRADFRKVPIIALTAHEEILKKDLCLKVGMNDFLVKPFGKDDLIAVIKRWAGKSTGTAAGPRPPEKDLPRGGSDAIDLDSAMKRLGGDAELLKLLLRRFIEQYAQSADQIRIAVLKPDLQNALTTLHTIKGSASMISAHRLYTASAELERCLMDRENNFLIKIEAFQDALKQTILDADTAFSRL